MAKSTGQSEPFRWAILGSSGVARKFAYDLRHQGNVQLEIVASRSLENAQRFAADFDVAQATSNYEEAAQAQVDALYIATPAGLHETHALTGIAAGKAVLIEKPMAPDAAAARRIAEAAEAAGVFCMEAMWTRFQPLLGRVQAEIAEGRLGQITGFDGQFMIANQAEREISLFDPEQAGGALLHRGLYPLSLAHFLLGPVTQVTSFSQPAETGVDADTVVLLRHGSGALSTVRASLSANGLPGTRIYGTAGTLELTGPVWRPSGAWIYPTTPTSARPGAPRRFEALRESGLGLRLSDGLRELRTATGRNRTRISAPFAGNGYRYEALAVMHAVRTGKITDPRMTPQDSIAVLELVDAAQATWKDKS